MAVVSWCCGRVYIAHYRDTFRFFPGSVPLPSLALSRKHPPQVLKKTKDVSSGKPRCSWPHDLITGRLRLKCGKRWEKSSFKMKPRSTKKRSSPNQVLKKTNDVSSGKTTVFVATRSDHWTATIEVSQKMGEKQFKMKPRSTK
ncbi:hypothetical protein TB2_031115 [Malus domestica]